MEERILKIVNAIRAAKKLPELGELKQEFNLREELGLTSFDLAELTVRIEDEYGVDIFEDGLVNTVGEIYAKLQK